MRCGNPFAWVAVAGLVVAGVARADTPPSTPALAQFQLVPPPLVPAAPVPDPSWQVAAGHNVAVEMTDCREIRGRLLGTDAYSFTLLGAGMGFGWHYLDTSGGRAVAPAATLLAKQDAPNPPASNPSPPREIAVVDGPLFPGLSRNPQPAERHARCAKGHACMKHKPIRLGAASPQV